MPMFTAPDCVQLHYTDEGEGVPVLALAGLTRNHRDFDFVKPHMKDVRFITMDYRGRGESEWADARTYTVPHEAADAIALLDHLGLEKAAILGTSRGGLIAMGLSATHPGRLLGVALNDIGPVIEPAALAAIASYVGTEPESTTYEEAAQQREKTMAGFANVPHERWLEEVQNLYLQSENGLRLRYDPKLADAVKASFTQDPPPDFWPVFMATEGRPLCAIRGENSGLLSAATFKEMQSRVPDMIAATVPDRAHVPFLDEPEARAALAKWLGEIGART